MKKFKLISLLFISTIIFNFNACSSGISQEEYDQKVQENNQLQEEISSIKSNNEELLQKNTELNKTNDKLLNIYKDLSDQLNKSLYRNRNITLESWAKTVFENPIVSFNEESKYFHCISQKKYSIDEDGIKNLYTDVLNATIVLNGIDSLEESNYLDNCDKIDIVFISTNNEEIVQYTLVKNNEDGTITFSATSILINATYSITIAKYLGKALASN